MTQTLERSPATPKKRTQGPRVIRFIEQNAVHPDGELIGQPLIMHPWWKQRVYEMFELKPQVCSVCGETASFEPRGSNDGYRCNVCTAVVESLLPDERRYAEAVIGVAKKNGKALSLDTPLPTPEGWTTMGEVAVGDVLFDENGQPCSVQLVTEVMTGHDCYRVVFSDGSSVVADAEHLWQTDTRLPKATGRVWTTEQIAASVHLDYTGSEGSNHRIRVAGALHLPDRDLPIPPYTLGAWLGDGTSSENHLTCADSDSRVVDQVRAEGISVGLLDYPSNRDRTPLYILGRGPGKGYDSLRTTLRSIGVLNNKHIPDIYLRAGHTQRLELLRGLMDTDGTITPRGQCVFTTIKPALRDGVIELLRTLGYKPTVRTSPAKINGRFICDCYDVQFWAFSDFPVFHLDRKRARQKDASLNLARSMSRHIVAVDPVESVPVRCIQVDSPSHLYLAGESMVPTHNTSVLAALGLYFLLADDDPSPLVVSAAASEEQGANLLYGSAKIMCELSPTLAKLTQPFDKEITVPSLPRARMRNVASKAGTQDGQNIKALLMDELHEWLGARGRNLFTVLSGGVGARFNAMRIAITTAGYDQESLCYEKYEYGKKVNAGEIDDPGYYFHWLEPAEDADYRDPKVWAIANPLLGVSVREEYIADRVKREPESVVRRYNCNSWVASEEIWIPYGVWDEGLSSLELDPSLPLYVGIDIARNVDSSAVTLAQKVVLEEISEGAETDEEEHENVRYVLRTTIWGNPYPENHELYASWRFNNNLAMNLCRELFERFPVPACEIDGTVMTGPMFAFDPWRFRPEAETLTGEGLAMVEFPQYDARMIPASQDFYEAIMKGQIAHDGDPALKRHVHAVTADQKPRGWRMSKPKGSKRKIDAAIAGAIAVHSAKTTVAPSSGRSAYAEHDLIVVG